MASVTQFMCVLPGPSLLFALTPEPGGRCRMVTEHPAIDAEDLSSSGGGNFFLFVFVISLLFEERFLH